MTLTKIVVTINGQEEIPLTTAEIAQYEADQIAGAAQNLSAAWVRYQSGVQLLLDKSDITYARAQEDGKTWPQTWKDYRTALRAIISAETGDPTQPLPTRPAYP